MKVAFYGTERKVGTSANMAVIAREIALCHSITTVNLIDYSHGREEKFNSMMSDSDLLVLNISLTGSGLEKLYLRNDLVHKNIIFLVGKYYHNQEDELKKLARFYRIAPEKVCAIPYNPRFQRAYENQKVSEYLKRQLFSENSLEDTQFQMRLQDTMRTILKYGRRKGDLYYG